MAVVKPGAVCLTGVEKGELDLVPLAWHRPRAANRAAPGMSVLHRKSPSLPGWCLLKLLAIPLSLLYRVGLAQQGLLPSAACVPSPSTLS